jgi:hypothetical protein
MVPLSSGSITADERPLEQQHQGMFLLVADFTDADE